MPIHDWPRVDAGVFHAFHLAWIAQLQTTLNSGRLPPDYYALGEQIVGGIGPDVLTLQATTQTNGPADSSPTPGTVAVAVAPPNVQLTVRGELEQYTRRQRTLVIRHVSGHRVVAVVEILSPGNKASRYAFDSFLNKAVAALTQGIHLLLIDLFPPGPRDPQGIHGALWEELMGQAHDQPAGRPLTLAAYPAGMFTAYVEPTAVGDPLIDMPLFLAPGHYINVPLEATYQASYAGVPRFYRDLLEAPSNS
jgi:hypothetical protein